jgi:peptide/nickel transport system substrate-binding protein
MLRLCGRALGLIAIALWASAGLAAEEPTRGGSAIVVIGADPAILNPNVTVGVPDVLTGCMLYDGLVRFAEGFRIVPSLAKRWEIGADGLTYTFHLVTASWSDGKPLTSDDVKYTLLEVSSKYGSKFVAPGKAIKDIETPDAETVVVTLSKPFGPFLFSLACDIFKNPASLTQPVGAGPFELTEWVRGDHLTLVRNPNYWIKEQPYLDRIIIKIIPDSSARLLALQAGEVDYIDQYYFPLSAYALLAKDPRFALKEVSYPSLDIVILNTRKPPLDRASVRQALLVAIDRNYLLKNVFLGTGQVARSIIDTRLGWAYNPAVDYEQLYPRYQQGRCPARCGRPQARCRRSAIYPSALLRHGPTRVYLIGASAAAILASSRHQDGAGRRRTPSRPQARLQRLRLRRDVAELFNLWRSSAGDLARLPQRGDQAGTDLQQRKRLFQSGG